MRVGQQARGGGEDGARRLAVLVLDQHLRALELDEPNGLLLCWESWGTLADADPDCFEMALEVFQDACIAWQADDFQATVLLVGDASETDLPTW